MSTSLHVCDTCGLVITLDRATTSQLLDELEQRARLAPGAWSGRLTDRVRELADKLNPISTKEGEQ